MGLDAVELIMRVEEDFAIVITDEDAEQIATPGALCELVERKLSIFSSQTASSSACPTSRAFYNIRRELMKLGIERSQVTPQTPLKALWPPSQRRDNWMALEQALDYDLPHLSLSPKWTLIGLLPLGAIPFLLYYSPATGIMFSAFYLIAWLNSFPTLERFTTHVPEGGIGTIAELARRMAPRFKQRNFDLWPQIQTIIADELKIPIEKVTRDAHFYRDLGLG